MKWKKFVLRFSVGFAIFYVAICVLVYFFQVKLIFHANPLPKDFKFSFEGKFEELNIPSFDKTPINGILFHADNPKGLVFYLHGNSGNLAGWGSIADIYTSRGYDLFIPDYRGFGKSGGTIESQDQVYKDLSAAYSEMKKRYPESKIIVAGYSIGSGLAAWVASQNHPKELMLQAPYFNLLAMANYRYPFLPTSLLQYRFETNTYLPNVTCPIWIFHGDEDQIIPVVNSYQLAKILKPSDHFKIIKGQDHFKFNLNPEFQSYLDEILR
ncbi:alpha/beta hydrolase [Flavobacterium silvaticum]|uniref:Alpha/beta hydrolase n=1 Tax=Flavobacterium silvaticum TaxID=1852020 RepID=A0A972JHK3_9FLAO|nr:alpha/beta fold hydrolase [Flavobacterium silvaticum]NMH29321.1 alpha/beta hydrolase [Flavobacterium silvaticum]